MMIAALLLLIAPERAELLDRADAANLGFVQCLFEQSRRARDANRSAADFERLLSGQCTVQEHALRTAGRRLGRQAGSLDALISDARRSVVQNYREAPALKEQLRAACALEPAACR